MTASLFSPSPLGVIIEALGWTLLHFIWQGALLALVLRIFLRFSRVVRPQIRYLAGCTVLAMMCAGALASFAWQLSASTVSGTELPTASRSEPAPPDVQSPVLASAVAEPHTVTPVLTPESNARIVAVVDAQAAPRALK